jgi:hypothetical protein
VGDCLTDIKYNTMSRGWDNVNDTTNTIDFKTKIEYSDMKFNNCLMYLEPRLQEYVKKKTYFTKNDITPSIPLEQEYDITAYDVKRINKLMKCKNQENCGFSDGVLNLKSRIRPKCGYVQLSKYVVENPNKFVIQPKHPTTTLQQDGTSDYGSPSLKEQFGNVDNIINDRATYEPQNRNCSGSLNPKYKKIQNKYDVRIDNSSFSEFRKPNDAEFDKWQDRRIFDDRNAGSLGSQERDWKQVYDIKPMKYRSVDYWSKNGNYFPGNNLEGRSINQAEVDIESTLLRPSYVDQDTSGMSRESYIDKCYKVVIPGGRNNSCYTDEYLNTAFYKAVPFMGQGFGQGDIDVESAMKYGEATRNSKQKKTGGALQDRFEELDRDIQDPTHIVLPFPRGGIDARAIDKWSKKDAQYVI